MEDKYTFTKEELQALMQELGKFPFAQVHQIFIFLDKIIAAQKSDKS